MTAIADAPTGSSPPNLTHRERMLVISGLMSGLLLSSLDQTIVGTALPTIVGELGGLEHLSWVVTAYLLASTASMPLYGKISDLLGRRRIFQTAIVIFLVGSVLCGAAQSLNQLIAFRGIQGLGAGGLMSLTFTIVGDIVPARERGRYTGYLTGVFAFSSVAGPLVGGFFVDQLSWRWIFYINLPIGAMALIVTSRALRLPHHRIERKLDLAGSGIMVASVVCLLLALVWGGTEHPWGSPPIVGLLVAAVVGTAAFIWWERRASEPVLPPRLFREREFTTCVTISCLMGAAMFGAFIYLPLYLQGVQGAAATNSGLLLLPIMIAMLVTSMTVGRLISRTGHYRMFPMVGTVVAMVALVLLSQLEADSSRWFSSFAMVLLGLGMGATLPVLTVATQNAVEMRDLGAGTAAVNFFRSLGGTIGVAAFGALLTSRLASNLADRIDLASLPAGLDVDSLTQSPASIKALPTELRAPVVDSLNDAVTSVFLVAAPVMAVAVVVAWFLRGLPLRTTHGPATDDESVAPPTLDLL